MITTVCKISYGSQTVPPIVPAVQGDTGRAISFEIADFTPPAGATATYFILKPSGEAIYNSATITDNSILCELTAQSIAEAGENRMQVRVLQGEDIVTSFEVILMVRTFLGDDAIESGTEMNIFDQAVEQATEQFQENAEQIVEEVIESIPADYTELTEEVNELNERLDTYTGIDTLANKTYTNNGNTATKWETNVDIPHELDDCYIIITNTKNVSSTGELLWLQIAYTDETTSNTRINSKNEWYKVNFDSSKTVSSINIRYTRSDNELSSPVESVWSYVIVKNTPLELLVDKALHLKSWAVGYFTFNYDKQLTTIESVGGYFFNNDRIVIIGSVNITIDFSQKSSYCIAADFENNTIIAIKYDEYLSYPADKYPLIAIIHTSGVVVSPFTFTINGFYNGLESVTEELETINSEINDIVDKDYTVTFSTSGNHSSARDTIDQSIDSGKNIELCSSFESEEEVYCIFVLTYSDETTENFPGRTGIPKTVKLAKNVTKIGVYFGELQESTTATFYVKELGDVTNLMNEVNTIINPDYGNDYSVNADGITKTYFKAISQKKLYVEEPNVGGVSVNQQGAAYEDGKVIIATHALGTQGSNCTLDIWDYDTATRLYSFPVPNDDIGHANNIIATGIKVAETDICSLLLISDGASAGSLCVCRVTSSGCTVLHKIQFNVSDVGYYANFMYNELNGTIVSLGYTIESVVNPNNNPMIVGVWDIANWNEPGATPTPTLRYKYTLPYMDIMNGGIIRNGIMYIMCTPFQYEDYTYVAISPIEIKSITNRWHFNVKSEFENINFVDDNTIIYGGYWFYKVSLIVSNK